MRFLLILLVSAATAFGQAFTQSDIPFLAQGSEWAARVVANGGPTPSANTINAMETLRRGLITAGLSGKIYSLCVFVPDSLTAALTPLIKIKGYDPWTNQNFDSTNLTIEGLKGDGTSKYLFSGVQALFVQTNTAGNCGLSVLITESAGNVAGGDIGQIDVGSANPLILATSQAIDTGIVGQTAFYTSVSKLIGNFAFGPDYGRCGFVSGNSINSNVVVYAQNPLIAQEMVASNHVTTAVTSISTNITVFAIIRETIPELFSAKRMSVALIHDGFTASEASTLASLLFACRTSIGGGTGDPIVNWNARVISLGGTDTATGTKTALRTFYNGLQSTGLRTNLVVANTYPPDNLTAARVPFVWRAGAELWDNHNFVSGDLSTNGLKGNGTTKYLDTAIIPNSVNWPPYGNTSAGLTMMVASNDTVFCWFMGCSPHSSITHDFVNFASDQKLFFRCWSDAGSSGGNYLLSVIPTNGVTVPWKGFISGNRTGASAINLYHAASYSTFAAAGTGASAQTSAIGDNTTFQLYVHAYNDGGSLLLPTAATISFVGVNTGLSSVQASNLYVLVGALRDSFGGGNP